MSRLRNLLSAFFSNTQTVELPENKSGVWLFRFQSKIAGHHTVLVHPVKGSIQLVGFDFLAAFFHACGKVVNTAESLVHPVPPQRFRGVQCLR